MAQFIVFIHNVNDVGSNLGEFTQELFVFANKFEWNFFSTYYFAKERVFKLGVELKEKKLREEIREIKSKIKSSFRIKPSSRKGKFVEREIHL